MQILGWRLMRAQKLSDTVPQLVNARRVDLRPAGWFKRLLAWLGARWTRTADGGAR